MYQVISLFGYFEPWWFLDDWKDDIIACQEFATFEAAEQFYLEEWLSLWCQFPKFNSQVAYLATFWDEKEQGWCEECDEGLQQYHSILLLKDDKVIEEDYHNERLAISNAKTKQPSSCRLSI